MPPIPESARARLRSSPLEYRALVGRAEEILEKSPAVDTIFMDPPDNIGYPYDGYDDALPAKEYEKLLALWVSTAIDTAKTVWVSFNSRHLEFMGLAARLYFRDIEGLEIKPCVQVYTFGQNNPNDLANCHRPLWRFRREGAPLYPEAVKIESWRLANGDKRAKPGGKVPGDVFAFPPTADDDVFDYPRVVGNSRQRRKWFPTQLHEGLVERCLRLTTPPGGTVLDPFCGSGTTLRVCKRIGMSCTTSDVSRATIERVREENDIHWSGL
jgi:hypothetical protein